MKVGRSALFCRTSNQVQLIACLFLDPRRLTCCRTMHCTMPALLNGFKLAPAGACTILILAPWDAGTSVACLGALHWKYRPYTCAEQLCAMSLYQSAVYHGPVPLRMQVIL